MNLKEASEGCGIISPVGHTTSFVKEKGRLILKKSPPNTLVMENT